MKFRDELKNDFGKQYEKMLTMQLDSSAMNLGGVKLRQESLKNWLRIYLPNLEVFVKFKTHLKEIGRDIG